MSHKFPKIPRKIDARDAKDLIKEASIVVQNVREEYLEYCERVRERVKESK